MLKMRTKTIHEVDVFDLGDFVEKQYGFNPETISAEEAHNDSVLKFNNIDGVLDPRNQEDADKLFSGKYIPYSTRVLLNKLCKDNHIPAGDYLIKVSW